MADAEIQNAVSKITAQMKSEGEVVKAVLLKTDGETLEVDWDSTPLRDHISEILGGAPTIIGELPGLPVVMTQKRESSDDPVNQHQLPPPFDKLKIHGDIFCTHLDGQAEPRDFTKAEFEQYLVDFKEGKIDTEKEVEEEFDETQIDLAELFEGVGGIFAEALKRVGDSCDLGKIDESTTLTDLLKAETGELGDDEEDAEEEDDGKEDEQHMEEVLETARRAYRQATGREPTVDELANILRKMGHNVPDAEAQEMEEEISAEDEKKMIRDYFTEFWGREPTDEELEKLSAKLPEFKKMMENEDDEYFPSTTELANAHKEAQSQIALRPVAEETAQEAAAAVEVD